MEKKLKKLFDYQIFAQNKHLDEVIRSVQGQEFVELSDDALFAVAGGQGQTDTKKEDIK